MKFATLNPQEGNIDLSASASDVDLQASALRNLPPSGRQVYIRATEAFLVKQETIHAGEFLLIAEIDAKRLVTMGRAVIVTEAEVNAAKKSAAAKA